MEAADTEGGEGEGEGGSGGESSYPESMLGNPDSSEESEWDLEEAGFEGLSPEAKAAMKQAQELWSLNSEGFKNSDTDGDEVLK
jgi:hypothetical protein